MCGKVTCGCKELIFYSVFPTPLSITQTPPLGLGWAFPCACCWPCLVPREPQIPLGMFSLPTQCSGCAHSD